ncbi:two-component sensor histidine kinase [Clostridium zeae]|uniref:histidine kinase n=1 Tax=Clostridium zeae TaxID=2759022 RepID=A0ABQ1EHV0_9CLOT|nr:sensor histidine kinase [Clostridium zeae]GFZ34402.1 two-component sensor histidine kinase [Clostridium zeae]
MIKKLIEKFNNTTLIKKFLISYISVIAIPILAVVSISYGTIQKRNREDILKQSDYKLDAEYQNIYRNMSIMGNIIQIVINNKEMLAFIGGTEEYSAEELVKFNNTTYKDIVSLQYNNAMIEGINIFTDNEKVNEIWPLIYRENRIKDNLWFQKTLENNTKVYWDINHFDRDINKAVVTNEGDPKQVVSLNRELRYPEDKHIGIVRINMDSKNFFPKMYENSNDDSNEMLLVNKNGKMYGNKDNAFEQNSKFNKTKFFDAFQEKTQGNNGRFSYKDGFTEYTVAYKAAPIEDCYLVSIIDIGKVNGSIKYTRNLFVIGTIFLIVMLSLIIYYITNIILRRLYIIIRSLKKVRGGDLNVEIPVYSNDEIGLLAHHFRQLVNKINVLIKDSIDKKTVTKEAELKALKNQLDAHFLYNTLENIRMMAEIEENYTVSDSLASLGDMMRYNMKWDRDYVPLFEEINHIKNYIALMGIRFEHDINLRINIDEKLMDKEVLKLSLQPLVENAVKHGLSKKLVKEDGTIVVDGKEDEQFTYITITDNGCGIDEASLIELKEFLNSSEQNTKHGLGMKNVYERIKIYYGEYYGIDIVSKKDYFTKIILKLPR